MQSPGWPALRRYAAKQPSGTGPAAGGPTGRARTQPRGKRGRCSSVRPARVWGWRVAAQCLAPDEAGRMHGLWLTAHSLAPPHYYTYTHSFDTTDRAAGSQRQAIVPTTVRSHAHSNKSFRGDTPGSLHPQTNSNVRLDSARERSGPEQPTVAETASCTARRPQA
jgi:hypothetical protein